jgi:hypothetical protein
MFGAVWYVVNGGHDWVPAIAAGDSEVGTHAFESDPP